MEDRSHEVRIENNGEDSLKDNQEVFQQATLNSDPMEHIQPYDSVVVDYKIPKINAIEVGKEILAVNPRQRIIFASPHLKDTLIESIQEIKQFVEILPSPFTQQTLVGRVEGKEIYSELEQLNVNIYCIKAADFRHDQLREMVQILRKNPLFF